MVNANIRSKTREDKYTLIMVDKSTYDIHCVMPISIGEICALEETIPSPGKFVYRHSESFIYYYEKAKDQFGEDIHKFASQLNNDIEKFYVLLTQRDNPNGISKDELKNINILLDELKKGSPI